MSSRPQFSLRLMLFVTAMVCLAAATARLSPSDASSTQRVAVQLQSYLRLAECLLFPAILTAWAVAKGGRSRTFCLGAILPAAMPMILVCFYSSALRHNPFTERPASVMEELSMVSFFWVERITAFWVCALLAGISAVFFRWFLPTGEVHSAEARQSLIVRSSLVVGLWTIASLAMIALPDSSQEGLSILRQVPIRLILCLVFPAMLAPGAVEGRGNRRAFCVCALFPALAPALLAQVSDAVAEPAYGRWEPSLLYDWRYFIVAMWAMALVFGLAALFIHWLFQFIDSNDKVARATVEKPG